MIRLACIPMHRHSTGGLILVAIGNLLPTVKHEKRLHVYNQHEKSGTGHLRNVCLYLAVFNECPGFC